jgi:hypothetical protein
MGWVVSYTPRQFYPRGKDTGAYWTGRWVDPERFRKHTKFFAPPETEPWFYVSPARSLVSKPTTLSLLRSPVSDRCGAKETAQEFLSF